MLFLHFGSVVSLFHLDQWEFSFEIRGSSLQMKNGVSVNEIKKGLQPAFWGLRFSTYSSIHFFAWFACRIIVLCFHRICLTVTRKESNHPATIAMFENVAGFFVLGMSSK